MTGTERKVFQKYYPPDFDPSKIPKAKGPKNRQFVQRVMAPFNMQCNTCREYIYKGKKFNMKRETAEGELYLGLKIFRFYFKCPNCLADISFKTDLENCDYQMEHGATRLFEAFKLYQAEQKKMEAQEEEDAKDPMKMLEKRTQMSRAEMEATGKLEELQELNRQHESVNIDQFLDNADNDVKLSLAEKLKRQEDRDEAEIRAMFGRNEDGIIQKRLDDEEEEGEGERVGTSRVPIKWEADLKPEPKPGVPQKRVADQKNLLSKMVVVKKKKEEVKTEVKEEVNESPGTSSSSSSSNPPLPYNQSINKQPMGGLLGLGAYGSGSDSD